MPRCSADTRHAQIGQSHGPIARNGACRARARLLASARPRTSNPLATWESYTQVRYLRVGTLTYDRVPLVGASSFTFVLKVEISESTARLVREPPCVNLSLVAISLLDRADVVVQPERVVWIPSALEISQLSPLFQERFRAH